MPKIKQYNTRSSSSTNTKDYRSSSPPSCSESSESSDEEDDDDPRQLRPRKETDNQHINEEDVIGVCWEEERELQKALKISLKECSTTPEAQSSASSMCSPLATYTSPTTSSKKKCKSKKPLSHCPVCRTVDACYCNLPVFEFPAVSRHYREKINASLINKYNTFMGLPTSEASEHIPPPTTDKVVSSWPTTHPQPSFMLPSPVSTTPALGVASNKSTSKSPHKKLNSPSPLFNNHRHLQVPKTEVTRFLDTLKCGGKNSRSTNLLYRNRKLQQIQQKRKGRQRERIVNGRADDINIGGGRNGVRRLANGCVVVKKCDRNVRKGETHRCSYYNIKGSRVKAVSCRCQVKGSERGTKRESEVEGPEVEHRPKTRLKSGALVPVESEEGTVYLTVGCNKSII